MKKEYVSDSQDDEENETKKLLLNSLLLKKVICESKLSEKNEIFLRLKKMPHVELVEKKDLEHQSESMDSTQKEKDNEEKDIDFFFKEVNLNTKCENLKNQIDIENKTNEKKSLIKSKRFLRKKRFSCNHPYISDLAHYLELENINFIDRMYEGEYLLDKIIENLNESYLKLKDKFPNDEKYYSKDFYTILKKINVSKTDSCENGYNTQDCNEFINLYSIIDQNKTQKTEENFSIENDLSYTLDDKIKSLIFHQEDEFNFSNKKDKFRLIKDSGSIKLSKKRTNNYTEKSKNMTSLTNRKRSKIIYDESFDNESDNFSSFSFHESSCESFENYIIQIPQIKTKTNENENNTDNLEKTKDIIEINSSSESSSFYHCSKIQPKKSMIKKNTNNNKYSIVDQLKTTNSKNSFNNKQTEKSKTMIKSKNQHLNEEILDLNSNSKKKINIKKTLTQSSLDYSISNLQLTRLKSNPSTFSLIYHYDLEIITKKKDSSFPDFFICNEIDIFNLDNYSKSNVLNENFNILINQKNFFFNCSDQLSFLLTMENFFTFILRSIKTHEKSFTTDFENDVYINMKILLKFFILHDIYKSEKLYKLLKTILLELSKYELNEKFIIFMPYFLFIYFVLFIQVSFETNNINQSISKKFFVDCCINYWRYFFNDFFESNSSDILNSKIKSKKYESFYIIFFLLKKMDKLWDTIVQFFVFDLDESKYNIVLDALCFLSIFDNLTNSNWKVFYLLYSKIKTSDVSFFHNMFLEFVFLLHKKFDWIIEEKIIMEIYSTITKRKFANFFDEQTYPILIGIINNFDDIPTKTFFEKFMLLLYIYFTNLNENVNEKKLIIKLLTSSHYQYKNEKKYIVMFINRMNFIMLLLQVSNLDFKNYAYDLIFRVIESNDQDTYDLILKSLNIFFKISIKKHIDLPLNCFILFFDGLIKFYFKNTKVISKFVNESFKIINDFAIKKKISLTFFIQLMKIIKKYNDYASVQIFFELLKLVYQFLKFLKPSDNEIDTNLHDEIYFVQKENFDLLNKLMNEDSDSNVEKKSNDNIEICIKIWVMSTYLISNGEWCLTILQKFFYVGNKKLREKFILFFYLQVLNITSLNNSIDDVIIMLLKSLVSYQPSKYTVQLINKLNNDGNDLIFRNKKTILNNSTFNSLDHIRVSIVKNIIYNLSNSKKTQLLTKKIYLENLLKTISSEYDKYFMYNWYKNFCLKVLNAIQKFCNDFINKNLFMLISSKVGLQKEIFDQDNFHNATTKERLITLHKELVNCFFFKKDYNTVLLNYTLSENVILIYHLISIYTKAIFSNQTEKWKLLYCLLNFFYDQLKLFKFNILNDSFKRFIKMLVALFTFKQKKKKEFEDFYTLKSMILIVMIFDHALTIFDGYLDVDYIYNNINTILERKDNKFSNQTNYLFSEYRLFDITQPGKDPNINFICEKSDEKIENLEFSLKKKLDKLKYKISQKKINIDDCYLFDFSIINLIH